MSYIYLIRHGRPVSPDGRTYCIGRDSDPPLSPDGRKQSKALTPCFNESDLSKVYFSSLKRSRETAELLSDGRWDISPLTGIDEISVGKWEGLNFDEIRAIYPDIYTARGKDWAITPPGGESLENAATRMEKAIREIASEQCNDILMVTHDGAIRALLWKLMQLDTKKDVMIRQPYGSITVLKYENGVLSSTAIGKLPEDSPTDEEIEELWDLCGTPENVRAHCYAVCEESLTIREQLLDTGLVLSHERLRAASLLHDMCRADGPAHQYNAAKLIRERGYLKVAHVVALHHGGIFSENIDESQVLFLADKRIDQTNTVTLQERFNASIKKCMTEEAKQMHNARYQQALIIEEKINRRLKRAI